MTEQNTKMWPGSVGLMQPTCLNRRTLKVNSVQCFVLHQSLLVPDPFRAEPRFIQGTGTKTGPLFHNDQIYKMGILAFKGYEFDS